MVSMDDRGLTNRLALLFVSRIFIAAGHTTVPLHVSLDALLSTAIPELEAGLISMRAFRSLCAKTPFSQVFSAQIQKSCSG